MFTRLTRKAVSFISIPFAWSLKCARRSCDRLKNRIEIANQHFKIAEYKLAVGIYTELHQNGNSEATGKLGRCYVEGLGVAKEIDKGIAFLKEAITRGDTFSHFYLGIHLLHSESQTEQLAGIEYLEKTPWGKNIYSIYAMLALGIEYLEGSVVVKNMGKASKLFESVASRDFFPDNGYRQAIYSFLIYDEALKTPDAIKIDINELEDKAIKNLANASKESINASVLLGIIYLYGSKYGTTKPNLKMARDLFEQAANKNKLARFYLSYLLDFNNEKSRARELLIALNKKKYGNPIGEDGLPLSVAQVWVNVHYNKFAKIPDKQTLLRLSKYGARLRSQRSQCEDVLDSKESEKSEIETKSPGKTHAKSESRNFKSVFSGGKKSVAHSAEQAPSGRVSSHSIRRRLKQAPKRDISPVKLPPLKQLHDLVSDIKDFVQQEQKEFNLARINIRINLLAEQVSDGFLRELLNSDDSKDQKEVMLIFNCIRQLFTIAPYKSFQIFCQAKNYLLELFFPDLAELLSSKTKQRGQIRIEYLAEQLRDIENKPIEQRLVRVWECILPIFGHAMPEKPLSKMQAENPTAITLGMNNFNPTVMYYVAEYTEKFVKTKIISPQVSAISMSLVDDQAALSALRLVI